MLLKYGRTVFKSIHDISVASIQIKRAVILKEAVFDLERILTLSMFRTKDLAQKYWPASFENVSCFQTPAKTPLLLSFKQCLCSCLLNITE